KAADAAASLFGGGMNSANVPSFELTADELAADARVTTMLVKSGLCKSQSDARNQIKAGAVLVADVKVSDMNAVVSAEQFGEDGLMLQKGKKGFRRLILK
ncbi:MAG: tyrosine--tRNA ligase, partial [Clostridia bacterium]|nr:tyrosine--tRNA ligase [Clostridia bacterium]